MTDKAHADKAMEAARKAYRECNPPDIEPYPNPIMGTSREWRFRGKAYDSFYAAKEAQQIEILQAAIAAYHAALSPGVTCIKCAALLAHIATLEGERERLRAALAEAKSYIRSTGHSVSYG